MTHSTLAAGMNSANALTPVIVDALTHSVTSVHGLWLVVPVVLLAVSDLYMLPKLLISLVVSVFWTASYMLTQFHGGANDATLVEMSAVFGAIALASILFIVVLDQILDRIFPSRR